MSLSPKPLTGARKAIIPRRSVCCSRTWEGELQKQKQMRAEAGQLFNDSS